MRFLPLIAALFLAAGLRAEPAMSRADFAKVMAKVKKEMSAAEVEKLLGKPDDIRTQEDVGGPDPGTWQFSTKEIWAYGTNAHMSFPTLGSVFFDTKNRVRYVYGGSGVSADPAMFPEAQLEDLLRIIDTAPGFEQRFDLLQLIRVVNTLQPLGKEKALAAMDEYLRVAPQHERAGARQGLFFVLRALFEVPEDPGYMPVMRIGAFSPGPPKDPFVCPRFPMVLMDDLPLVLTTNYTLFGAAEPVSRHVQYFREHGRMRALPLQPPDDPLAVFAQLEKSRQWVYRGLDEMNGNWGRAFVTNQLLGLVSTVYRPKTDPSWENKYSTFNADRWSRALAEFPKVGTKWNASKNCYVFADGSALPPLEPLSSRRVIWKLPALGSDALLILERGSAHWVEAKLYNSILEDSRFSNAFISIFETGAQSGSLADFHVSDGNRGRTYTDFQLESGKSVQVKILIGSKRIDSPVFTP